MKRIDDSVIEEIRNRTDIVETIGLHIALKRSGSNFKGLCPFHEEKTPSFMVHPDKQIFYCFGCGEGGNVITFLIKYQGQTFLEVIQDLANQVGINLSFSESNQEKEQTKQLISRINTEALNYFRWAFEHKVYGKEAREYLSSRKISSESIEKFQIGYSMNNWSALYRHMKNKGYNDSELLLSGLFGNYENRNGLYDLFRHRVMFPIISAYDQVIAFGGRTMGDSQAKYINSPETKLYHKSQHLFGLNLAKQPIRRKNQVLLVEGYLDVITAHQYGFDQTVASLGTALTPQQAKQLIRFTPGKNVVVAYDSDKAGQKATQRGIDVFSEITKGIGIQLKILTLPNQEDPDTILQREGTQKFQELIDTSVPFIEYQIDKTIESFDISQSIEKSKAVSECIKILKTIHHSVYLDECIQYIAEKVNVREESIRQLLNSKSIQKSRFNHHQQYKKQKSTYIKPAPVKINSEQDKNYLSEIGLLFLYIEHKDERERISLEIKNLVFENELNENIRKSILSEDMNNNNLEWTKMYDYFQDEKIHKRLAEMQNTEYLKEIDLEKSLADFLRNVKLKYLNYQIKQLSLEIKEAEIARDDVAYQNLMTKYANLLQVFTQLKNSRL